MFLSSPSFSLFPFEKGGCVKWLSVSISYMGKIPTGGHTCFDKYLISSDINDKPVDNNPFNMLHMRKF